jgi:hypothetical protein
MRLTDVFRKATSAFRAQMQNLLREDMRMELKGEVFMVMRDGASGKVQEERHIKNLVVRDASILVARLLKDNAETGLHGAFVLAVGTGDTGWDPMSPPAPTDTQRALYSELTRKRFQTTTFVTSGGLPVSYPTNIVDYTTVFSEAEAVGPLVEMALLGGNISTNMSVRNPVPTPYGPNSSLAYDALHNLSMWETELNYLTFPIVNKPATSTLAITWRLTT